MEPVLFNIVTRVSRKNYFRLCYDSIHNQTYKNFRHIVTYETEDMRQYLEQFDNLILVKVPNKQSIKGLQVCWNHNPTTEDYFTPDHEFLDYRSLNRDESSENNIYINDSHQFNEQLIKTPPKDGFEFHHTGNKTWREYAIHAPYNWYLKLAEKEFKQGWVIYVDDDDQLYENTSLEKLQKIIKEYNDEDVLHINRFSYPNGYVIPDDNRNWLYSYDYPFVHRQISGVCLCFHTKWSDYTYWDEWSSADYRTAVSLRKAIGKVNMTNLLAVKLTSGTHGGSLEDI